LIIKVLSLALACTLLLSGCSNDLTGALACTLRLPGCSNAPGEEERAATQAAQKQAAAKQKQLQEYKKIQTFLDGYEPLLQPVTSKQGLELERQETHWAVSIPVDDFFNLKRQAGALLPSALPRIAPLVQLLQADEEAAVLIVGHLDAEQAKKSPKLSAEQAQAVSALFRLSGMERTRVLFKGAGADRPRADNNSDKGRQRNRRVEVLITPKRILPHALRLYSHPPAAGQSSAAKNSRAVSASKKQS